jgi:DNA-binding MarR family transcriptional regulator
MCKDNLSNQLNFIGPMLMHTERSIKENMLNKFNEEGLDITGAQYQILLHLWKNDGLTQKEIQKITMRTKAAMAKLVDGLEERNLVTRIPDPNDLRCKSVYLTPKGKRIKETLLNIGAENEKKAMKGISPEEIELLKNILGKIMNNMNNRKK